MNSKTNSLIELWSEARTRFSDQLNQLSENDLTKKLAPSENSIGYLVRHIGDVELLFAKNVFGSTDLKVKAKTVIAQHDTEEWINLTELKTYLTYAYNSLKTIIESQSDAAWESTITTKEFGTKTKAAAFGRIVSHTTYHAGQIALIKKYGN